MTLRELLRPYVLVVPLTLEERLARYIDYRGDDECWIWNGHTNPNGYGKITLTDDGKRGLRYVHRVVYELLVGPIPEGLDLDHLCNNPSCCNPDHLKPVTTRENVLRGNGMSARNAVKTHCPQGHPYDEPNTMVVKTRHGLGRKCRQCNRDRDQARRQRDKGVSVR